MDGLKRSPSWHSRVGDHSFFSMVMCISAVFSIVVTLNGVTKPVGILSIFADEPNSMDNEDLTILMPHPVDLSSLSDVYHDMSDEELLWRVSSNATHRQRDESVAPKVAYMFLTRGPLPLEPLWERYFEGHEDLYTIYIHAHPNFLPNFRPDSVFYRRNIPSKVVEWGKMSVFAAERRLLANALLDAANERFVLLSESCIPITPFPVAYQYFLESQHSFVDVFIDMGPGGIGRYYRIKKWDKLNPEISASQWRKGSQWFELSRELALLVVADTVYYPKYESILCMNDVWCYVDEHYLPTVLTLLAPSKLANRTTTYLQFPGSRHGYSAAHPYKWDAADVTETNMTSMLTGHNCTYNGKMTDGCYMFARKFAPETIQPLLELASASFGIP